MRGLAPLVALGALTLAGPVQAQAFRLVSRTEAHVYHLRSFRGLDAQSTLLVPRRRLVQSLLLDGYEMVTGQDLSLSANLRVFADFGMARGEPARLDGVRAEDADLLNAHVTYRAAGFQARLGRQVRWDSLDAFALDGLHLRYVSPFKLGLEAYGGLSVKGASFLGSSAYQPDGIREIDVRRPATPENAPSRPEADDLEPVVGGRLVLEDLHGFSGGLEYRRAFFLDERRRVSLERAGAELRYQAPQLGLSAVAAADVDLVLLSLANLRVEARHDGDLFAVSAELARYTPVLAVDSIWYWFTRSPRDEISLRGDYLPPGPARAYVRLNATRLNAALNPQLDLVNHLNAASSPLTAGGSMGGALLLGAFHAAADVTFRAGGQGGSVWLDLSAGYAPAGRPYSVDTRFSYANVRDGLQPALDGHFAGVQLWGGYALSPAARLSAVLEHNASPRDPADTKVFGVFELITGGLPR
jgi:hypothetical protein